MSHYVFVSAGIFVANYGTVRIDNTEIDNNQVGIQTTGGGQVVSFRTNAFSNNGADGTPSLSTALK